MPVAAEPSAAKRPWPKLILDQVRAVQEQMRSESSVVTVDELARRFRRAKRQQVAEILDALATLGKVREVRPREYAMG